MASRRIKLILAAALLIFGGGGYFLYSVFAAQARPGADLAQAPLNTQVQVPPAFIMAVDDSGSMTYQVLLRGLDGGACWSGGSFYNGTSLNACTDTGSNYWYIMPHSGYTVSRSGRGLPPLDSFGFARSPETNPSYFDPDPSVSYGPWLESDSSPHTNTNTDDEGNADIAGARADPRNEAPLFDFTGFSMRGGGEPGAASFRFEVRNGMRLPVGTRYYATGNCGNIGGTGATRNTWVNPLTTELNVNQTCTVGLRYYPATFYLKTNTPAPAGYKATVVAPDANNRAINGRVLAVNACGAGCDMYRYEIRQENYTDSEAYAAAIQKFANWFSYYGNRNRAMIAGMTRSMLAAKNMRVGYFTLKNRPATVTMHDMQSPDGKSALYSSMMGLPASGGTPNLRAVDHIGRQFADRSDSDAPIKLACQKNAGMLFTDGFSNDGTPGAPAITGLGAPFDPTPAGSMAAIATRYYLNTDNTVGVPGTPPLRPELTRGQVPIDKRCGTLDPDSVDWKRLDCQSNLHMNLYGITLGPRGVAFDPDQEPPRDPYIDTPVWPAHQNDQPTTVDDIWHATVNTRGKFINARTPADIAAAMRSVILSVSAGDSPSGSIALTGARIGSGSLVVTSTYDVDNEGTDWSSTLVAHRVTVGPTRVAEFEEAWEASERMASGTRRVFYSKGDVVDRFNVTNPELEDLCSKPDGLYSEMLRCEPITSLGIDIGTAVDYLLGRRNLEKSRGGLLRDRKTVLGDIVNSTPVVSAPTDDYGYRSMIANHLGVSLGNSYATYLEAKRGATQNRRYMVYVGANDGMLHAFDGGMTAAMAQDGTAPDGNGGTEKFGYVPATALGHMGNLLFPHDPADQNDQKFQHRYYVDGPITVSDAHYDGGDLNGWSTVLVGTAGAGGRSVFALDVSEASKQSGQFDSGDRLWEISDLDTTLHPDVRANIGYVLGRPVIVPVKTADGTIAWKAVFGNGYNSASGKAVLFLVDIGTGTPSITMIEAEESGAGVPTGKNGLGNVVVIDRWRGDDLTQRGRDGFADTVYAGDQKGALWKFDLRASSPADVGMPLFVTRSHTEGGQTFRQPITGGITAAAGPGGGVMLYFGTGSFSFYGDPEDDTLQSLYAVNDTETSLPSTSTRLTRGNLNGRVVAITNGVRTLTSGSMITGSKGWYIDLATAERFVGHPNIAAGTVFMPTYIPDPNVSGCSAGGENWLFGLNARTGAAALSNVRSAPGGDLLHEDADTAAVELVDEQGNSIDSPIKDVGVLVVPRDSPGAPVDPEDPGAPPDPPDGESCWMLISASGADPMYLPYPCGRQSWRQIQ